MNLTHWYKTAFLEAYIEKYKIDTSSFKHILEIGARDCKESLSFTEIFPNAHITAFECNPRVLPECRSNAAKSDRISLIEKMVTDTPSSNEFYLKQPFLPFDEGVASLCQPIWEYDTVYTDTIRMDQFLSDQIIDFLWIDVQGAEVKVIESFGSKLNQVNTIYCEVDTVSERYRSGSDEPKLLERLNMYTVSERLLLGPTEAHLIFNKNV